MKVKIAALQNRQKGATLHRFFHFFLDGGFNGSTFIC